jgi:hypothetical protein
VPYPCLNFVVCENLVRNLGVMVSEKRQRWEGVAGLVEGVVVGGVEGTMSVELE